MKQVILDYQEHEELIQLKENMVKSSILIMYDGYHRISYYTIDEATNRLIRNLKDTIERNEKLQTSVIDLEDKLDELKEQKSFWNGIKFWK